MKPDSLNTNSEFEEPEFSDGHDWEGFEGGCSRFGCPPGCSKELRDDALMLSKIQQALREFQEYHKFKSLCKEDTMESFAGRTRILGDARQEAERAFYDSVAYATIRSQFYP